MEDTEMQKVIARMPQHARDWIATQLNQKVDLAFKNEPYFSRVRFEPATSGTTTVTYAFTAQQSVQAFTYGINGSMAPAGYNATGTGFTLGTIADTNLVTTTGKVTNNSDLVVIDGLAIEITPRSDPVLTRAIIADLSVSAGFGGNVNDYKLATVETWPGSMGLYGSSSSPLSVPNLQDANGIMPGVLNNGIPGAHNVRWFSDPIVWMPAPAGDSLFAMQLRLERAISVAVLARTAGTGVQAIVPPQTAGADGTFVEFKIFLLGNQFGPRSRNR